MDPHSNSVKFALEPFLLYLPPNKTILFFDVLEADERGENNQKKGACALPGLETCDELMTR